MSAATCREYLGPAGWCPRDRVAGDYCTEHAAKRRDYLRSLR